MMTNAIVILCSLLLVRCDEMLPPRDEPRDFVESSYSASESAVEIRDSIIQNSAGTFIINVKNIYVEVLQDEEFARADIEVWKRDAPEHRGTIVALRRDLTNQGLVSGGMLTLRPNETATFLKQWSHKTSSGRWFWEFVRLTEKRTQLGERYYESDSVHFAATGRAQLFKTRAPERLPLLYFSLIYRIFV